MNSIPREIAPPPELEQKIARELRRQGLLRDRRRVLPYLAAAAVLAIVIVWQLRPAPPAPNYILLLYESPQFSGGNRAEYGQWARQMRPLIVGGEELGSRDVFANVPTTTPRPAGYFLIDAADDAAAARVAQVRTGPRHGGAVVLRKIVQ